MQPSVDSKLGSITAQDTAANAATIEQQAATPGDQTVNQPSLAQMSPSAGMTREKPKRAPTEANEPSRRTRHRREDVPRETDPKRLKSRSKQIEFGKNTIGYNAYRARVPKEKRKRFTDPVTPDIYQVCSKRSWDGQVQKWRRELHNYDPERAEDEETPVAFEGAGEAEDTE